MGVSAGAATNAEYVEIKVYHRNTPEEFDSLISALPLHADLWILWEKSMEKLGQTKQQIPQQPLGKLVIIAPNGSAVILVLCGTEDTIC